MTQDLALVLGLLAATVVMFSLNRPRMDVVALMMMTALPLFGLVSVDQALAGFSDPNIVLIAALFVIGEGLVRTGVAQRLGDYLMAKAGRSEKRLIPMLMTMVAGIGAFMSSTGVVAIFIPVVLRIAANARISAGRLMMPLSVAALISGMMTLVATPPNLIVNSELSRQGIEGFSFFAFTPFGLPILALAIVYMLFARRWLLGKSETASAPLIRPNFAKWADEYSLHGREHRLSILPSSPWAGKRLDQLDLRSRSGTNVISIERKQRFANRIVRPTADVELQAGDAIFLDVSNPNFDIDAFCREHGLRELPLTGTHFTNQSRIIGMAEVMIPATSSLEGKTVVQATFRTKYGLAVLGLKRGQKTFEGAVLEEPLHIGDTLLVVGTWQAIRKIGQGDRSDVLLLNMPAEFDNVVPAPSRAPYSIGVLAFTVLLMVIGAVPNVLAVLIGCLLLGLFKCVDMNSAYRSIHWQSLIVIVGMLPFSLALQATGGIDLAVSGLQTAFGGAEPHVMLAALFGLTAILGLFISNTATAVLMAPIAVALAGDMSVSPLPFCMGVALAASAAFMTPVSSPVNTLVAGPGKYTFLDFVRVGVPFTVVVMLTTVFLVPLVFPFHPAP